jgi:hypothetical protein
MNERGACGADMPIMVIIVLYMLGVSVIGAVAFLMFAGVCEALKEILGIDIQKKIRDKWGRKC